MAAETPPQPPEQPSLAVAALGRALVRAWNDHDASAVATLCASDVEGFDVADAVIRRGPDDVRRASEQYLAAFPDLVVQIEELLADDRRLALAWVAQATHAGPIMRIPPTQRPVRFRGVCVLTIEHGKIRQAINVWDVAGMLRGIGLLPDLVPTETIKN